MRSLADYGDKWNLREIRPLAKTFTSDVYTAKQGSLAVVLKVLSDTGEASEAGGAATLRYFNGHGAVRLLNADEGAHLLEAIDGSELSELVADGRDDQATEIICDVLERIHSCRGPIPAGAFSMKRNFLKLFKMASNPSADEIYKTGARVAEKLIATEREVRVLHGDVHHANILHSSTHGWLLIDPKCLAGERTYDVANVFYNPTAMEEWASSPEVILRRRDTFARRLNLDAKRILEFAFAYGCLSACWSIEDGQSPDWALLSARKIRLLI